jgi:hypothetical protein
MPRFFFNFRNATTFSPDEEGLELPDLDAAYLEAFEAAKEMWGEAILQMRNPGRQQFEISDVDGKTLLIVPFKEVINSLKGVPKPHPLQTAERATRLTAEIYERLATARERLAESIALLLKLP